MIVTSRNERDLEPHEPLTVQKSEIRSPLGGSV